MIHHIQEEWLLKLEEKLQIATLKSDRLEERLNKILARTEICCQKAKNAPINDISDQIRPNLLTRVRNKLAIKRRG
jgi:hypothetical protein